MVELDPTPYPIDALTKRGAPEAIALEDRAGTLIYAELEVAVAALALWLRGQGLEPGDRVATWLPKTRHACVMPLAALSA